MDTFERNIAALESSLARIALCCMAELPFNLGLNKLCDILRGSNATFILDHKLHGLKTYGALAAYRQAQLCLVIDSLLEHEYIYRKNVQTNWGSLPVLAITEKGRLFMASGEVVAFGFNRLMFDPVISKLKERDFELFAKLRSITKAVASQHDVPCYCILGPRSMLEMAFMKPQTRGELQSMPMIRKDFSEKFADEYLPAITQFTAA